MKTKKFAELLKKIERAIQGYEASDINYTIDVLEEIVKNTNVNIIAETKE